MPVIHLGEVKMAYSRGLFKRLEDLPIKLMTEGFENSKYTEEKTRLIFDAYKGSELVLRRYLRDSADPYKQGGLSHYHADQIISTDLKFRANPDLFSKDTARSDSALAKATRDLLKGKGYGRTEETPSMALSLPDFQVGGSKDLGGDAEWYRMNGRALPTLK